MKLIIGAFYLLISISVSFSQSLVASGSAFDVSPDKKTFLSWTIGDIAIETHIVGGANSGRLDEGFLIQKYTSWSTSIDFQPFVSGIIRAYPNPTNDYLTIESQSLSIENVEYELIDVQGKSLLQGSISLSVQSTLFLGNLPTGFYWLKITDSKAGKYASFLIQKQ